MHLVVLDKNKTSGPTISCLFEFKSRFIRIGPWKPLWTHLTWLGKKSRGTNLRFLKSVKQKIKKLLKSVFCTHGARAHTRCLPSTLPIQLLSSPRLFGPHHSPQSKPVFIKLLWNVGKADTEEVGVYLGGAKYFMALSIAHCDWVVYAVNAGDKPMGHWLLVVPAWWSLAKKKKNNSVGPFSARPTGKMPGMPDYQSSPELSQAKNRSLKVCI